MPKPPQKYLEQPISPRGSVTRKEFIKEHKAQDEKAKAKKQRDEAVKKAEEDRLHNIKWKKIREGQYKAGNQEEKEQEEIHVGKVEGIDPEGTALLRSGQKVGWDHPR